MKLHKIVEREKIKKTPPLSPPLLCSRGAVRSCGLCSPLFALHASFPEPITGSSHGVFFLDLNQPSGMKGARSQSAHRTGKEDAALGDGNLLGGASCSRVFSCILHPWHLSPCSLYSC